MPGESLADLVQLVPPPLAPVGADEPWGPIEEALGFALPLDYKELVGLYGAGTACGRVGWTSPSRFLAAASGGLEVIRRCQEVGLTEAEPLWPDRGGLLPWAHGSLQQADLFCMWRMREGDLWPVVLDNGGFSRLEVPGSTTEVLFDMLAHGDDIDFGWWPTSWHDGRTCQRWFEPRRVGRWRSHSASFVRPPGVFFDWLAAAESLFDDVIPRFLVWSDFGDFDVGFALFQADTWPLRVQASMPGVFSVSVRAPFEDGPRLEHSLDNLVERIGEQPIERSAIELTHDEHSPYE